MFGSKDAIIRLDMSEYSDRTAVSKLIGTTAGYVATTTIATRLLNVFVVTHTQLFFLMKLKKLTLKSSHFFSKFWMMVV